MTQPADPTPDAPEMGGAAGASDAPGAGSTLLSWLREIAIVVVGAVVLSVVIKTFLVQAFFIPSESMRDGLQVEDRVLVTRLAPRFLEVNRGDVVVFVDPSNWLSSSAPVTGPQGALGAVLRFIGLMPQDAGDHLIKRVVGVAGDTVACCTEDGLVTVNGVAIDETYLAPRARPSEVPFTAVVPEGYLWLMGDNRQNSRDSRYHLGDPGGGAVPLHLVVGIAQVRVWPVDRWALLRNPAEVFAAVP